MLGNSAETRERLEKLKGFPSVYELILTQCGVGSMTHLGGLDDTRQQRLNLYVDYYYNKFFLC
ncbi:MAG: hypothetical protein HQL57_02010 [Magnetococcales bacterium]|nr:hypothetical protein [Magnetococcales bacterium]MBF0155943.1 hypothetical protein [Magnetococcales bacterium]